MLVSFTFSVFSTSFWAMISTQYSSGSRANYKTISFDIILGVFTHTHRDVMHPAVLQLLLKLISRVLQSLARSLDVVHRDADMPETFSGLLVAIVWLVGSIILRAIVVSELNNALAISPVIARGYGLGRVATDPTTSALRFTRRIQFLSSHGTHYAKKYKSKELSGNENLLTCFIPKCS